MLVNSCRPWLGAVAAGYPQVPGDSLSQTRYHETRIGRQLDVVRTYYGPNATALTANDVYFATRPNTILDVNWIPTTTWGAISAAGATIDEMAASIRALGSHKIMLTIWHEPENDVSPRGDANCPTVQYKGSAGTVAQYRAMWAYVEKRFAEDGVKNVVWAMDYMNYAPYQCLVNDLYPGNNLVDWILFNGYDEGAPDPSFTAAVGRFYTFLTENSNAAHDYLSKPWGIAEWGIYGYSSAQEEKYYAGAKTALDENLFPRLKLYTIFDDINTTSNQSYRVAYDDNGRYDLSKGRYYYAFADDPRFTDAYYTSDHR